MIKNTLLHFCLAGLFVVLQGCCFDSEEVDIYFSNKTSEPIYVQMQLTTYNDGDLGGTKTLYARPWSFDRISPDSTFKWGAVGSSNKDFLFVIVRQNTIDRHDSIYLSTHCLYDSAFSMTMSQLIETDYRIEYK